MNKLKKTEEKYQIGKESRIKFVEMSGKKYVDYFKESDPFYEKCQPEENCLACRNKDNRITCKTSNIGYQIECVLCKDRGKEALYIGESARNALIRSKEHVDDLEKKRKKSVLNRHIVKEHDDEENKVSFQMRITGRFTNNLGRQIDESRRIRNTDENVLLNFKAEFYGPCIKRKVYEA